MGGFLTHFSSEALPIRSLQVPNSYLVHSLAGVLADGNKKKLSVVYNGLAIEIFQWIQLQLQN